MRSHWIGVGPIPMAGISIRREKFGERDRPRGRTGEDGGRVWNDAATSRGTLRIAESNQELGRSKDGFFPRASRGTVPRLTP